MQLFYTVRPGDTLYQIARRWAIPVDSLIAANNVIPPYTIYVGQQLSVPPGVDVIRVRPGDTIYTISQYFGVPQALIFEINQLEPPYTIQVGQLLKVPPGNPYYIVQPGDTLYQIARRFNVITGGRSNYELIRQVNRLPSNLIFPGMKLVIPYAPLGDQGFIAYISNRGGSYDLWLYNLSDGGNVQLTTGLGDLFSIPFWSPDSRHIAFVGRNRILYVFNLAEEKMARIDQFEEGEGSYLNWSPDSRKLVYTRQNHIILYDVFTHQSERILQPGATDTQWFPNGTELLFQAPDPSGISQLFRIQTDGTGKRQITQNTGGRLNHVRLSPDGLYALYTTPGVSISLIYTVDIITGIVSEVRGGPLAKNYFPAWSPDSSSIAYSATAFENIGYFSLIRTVGRQGEGDRTRAISNCFATPITWSPDGRNLAYLSGCNNQGMASELWSIDIGHPVPIRLIEGVAITSLQWSPMPNSALIRTYRSTIYKVQFQYPAHWQKITDERYEGTEGFFQISAISSDEPIHKVCQNEAFQQLLPYGSSPRTIQTQIQHQEACFIIPSEDQPTEMRNQAALIVQYPQPIPIEGTTYNYFILWADQDHINEISSTLIFL
ncbi:LysM peptidoglycan-binding domain-containing protein [Halalkalibacter alkalisediminis]|uniref:LysM peptidoglycan-binding domain-containing protein n=2 Tax=Halalkalibacter alkalisediminis TaxID=935616 RepID=A0ABV6NNF9_9BACI|nr:LysM peptidoglycan-binding domain-containing protein [Halalkalibacter alkalisediminis]